MKKSVFESGLMYGLIAVFILFAWNARQVIAQQGAGGANAGNRQGGGMSRVGGFGFSYPEEYQTGDAVAVMTLERNIEAAVVRGDVPFLDGVLSDDFVFVHGSGWVTGGKPLAQDDKAAFLKRAQEKQYLVHDLDGVKIEMHGDLAITYGRYVSLFAPPDRSAGAQPSLSSIWFERIFEKRNGKWMWLSHRTVYGPIPSPAGIDPTQLDPEHQGSYVPGLPVVDVPPQEFKPSSPEAAEIFDLDQKIDTSIPAGDSQFFDSVTSDDFIMYHGDGWTRGGHPNLIDNKGTFLQRVKDKQYLALEPSNTQVEMHGDVALTFGRYIATLKGSAERSPKTAWFSVWIERVYQKRNGKWTYLSCRTAHGATYGPSKEAVSNE